MELTSLRSVLQHQCPDLQNLTTIELQECKWPTKKKIFTALVTSCSVLQEQSEELAALNDDRNAESTFQKKQGVPREDRVESEMSYRTKFMRIVLSGLTRLRWPPTQEAFSDPIDMLFNDDASFIDAVRFISQVGLPAMALHHYRKDDVESPPKPRPHSGSRQKRATTNEHAFNSSISIIQNDESNDLPDVSELGISLQNVTGNLGAGAWGIAQQDEGRSVAYTPSEFGGQSHSAREKRADLNWKAFEVLQRQNEQLSARLRELQFSVLRRDESEAKIAGIISELRSTVAEIADAGNVNAGDKKAAGHKQKAAVGASDNSFATILRPNDMSTLVKDPRAANISTANKEQEMEVFRQEAEREAQELLAKKDKVKTSADAVPIASSSAKGKTVGKVKPAPVVVRASPASDVAPPSAAASVDTKESPRPSSYAQSQPASAPSVLWSKLLGRVTSLEAQWTGAQRAARHLAEHSDRRDVSKGNALKGSPPLQRTGGQHGSSSAAGTKYSAGLTPSRSIVNHSFGVQPALFNSEGIGGGRGREDGSFGGGGDSVNSPPQPPFSSRTSASGHSFAAISEQDRLGLDLSRIHLLQRDLVAFAENAFDWTADTVFPSDSHSEQASSAVHSRAGRDGSAQRPVVLSVNERALKRQQSALALQTAAWDLLLHLSCVSPIAPLALDSPLRSSMTGLDALIHEMSELAFPKVSKQAQTRLQAAADRALSEQVAVIRCWRQARSCLSQWTEHSTAVAPMLQGVSKRYRSVVEQTAQELQEKSSSLSLITQALREAEAARIRSTAEDPSLADTSSRSASFRGNISASSAAGVPISPLDSLARGSAGREVAALVNALRANKDELADSAQAVSTLGSKLVSELRRELELFSYTEGNLTAAVDTTHRLLQSSRPGAGSAGTGNEEEFAPGAASAGLRKATRRRAAETTSPKAATGSAKLAATPLSSRPAFDLSLS